MNMPRFNPSTDIPSLAGKVVMITGGYSGLGRQTALELANHDPAQIWITGRDASKANSALNDLKAATPGVPVRFLEMDLASFASIRKAAKSFISQVSRLDILILNAGIMGGPPSITKDGYEMHFGIHHMGHALLLELLTPVLDDTSAPRVVFVSSDGHRHANGIPLDSAKSTMENLSVIERYTQSKLANVVYAREVAKRYPQWTTVSVHPGNVKTELHREGGGPFVLRAFKTLILPLIGVTAEEGARNQLWAATTEMVKNGEYYDPVGVAGKASVLSKDAELGRKLWNWTREQLQASEGVQ